MGHMKNVLIEIENSPALSYLNHQIESFFKRMSEIETRLNFAVQHSEKKLTHPCYHNWNANQATGMNFCHKCGLKEEPSICHDCTHQYTCISSSLGKGIVISLCSSLKL